jgi:hypothetical protein
MVIPYFLKFLYYLTKILLFLNSYKTYNASKKSLFISFEEGLTQVSLAKGGCHSSDRGIVSKRRQAKT